MHRSRLAALLAVVMAPALIARPAIGQGAPQATRTRSARLLGVYDEITGEPIEGARVLDLSNGLSVSSSKTGTLALFFVDSAGGLLRITRLGYEPKIIRVSSAASDSVPLTVTLFPVEQELPTVIARGRRHLTPRGPADTVRRLDDVGFYDRRYTTGAPSASFITAEQLAGLRTLDDLSSISGRAVCAGNVYVDGVRVTVPSRNWGNGRVSQLATSPLDAIIPIDQIAGVEMYNGADAPEEFNATEATGATLGCATLIWTK